VTVAPGTATAEPSVFVTERSATGAPKEVDAVAVLFPAAGSGVGLVAVAVTTIGSGVV
jgi:hypothetical protein